MFQGAIALGGAVILSLAKVVNISDYFFPPSNYSERALSEKSQAVLTQTARFCV